MEPYPGNSSGFLFVVLPWRKPQLDDPLVSNYVSTGRRWFRNIAVLLGGLIVGPYLSLLAGWLTIFGFGEAEGPVGGLGLLLLLVAGPIGFVAASIIAAAKPGLMREWHWIKAFAVAIPLCAVVAAWLTLAVVKMWLDP